MLAWTLWLLLAFFLNLYVDGGLDSTWAGSVNTRSHLDDKARAAIPAARWMLQSALVGLMLIWPALRLSQRTPPMPSLATAVELLGLLIVLQVVVWPIHLTRRVWSIEQAVAMDVALAFYATLAAVAVDVGRRGGHWRRTGAMAACVAMALGGIVVAPAETSATPWHSPPLAIWSLSQPQQFGAEQSTAWQLVAATAVVAVAWAALARVLAAADTGARGEKPQPS